MISETSGFRHAILSVRQGDSDAVWELIKEYGPHIHRYVKRKLDRRMRSKFDSVDFVQMVWASIFRHPSQLATFNEPSDLLRFLYTMARNKVYDEYRRRLHTGKYNVTLERSMGDQAQELLEGGGPTPSEIAMAREKWDEMVGRSERTKQVVELRIGGATYEEIGQALGIHERTARKIIDQLIDSETERPT